MNKWDFIIQDIAQQNHTTPQKVRQEMIAAMKEGQRSSNPKTRAKWNSIPRKGTELTIEEFLDYLLEATSHKAGS